MFRQIEQFDGLFALLELTSDVQIIVHFDQDFTRHRGDGSITSVGTGAK